jgi:hypothetical protein
MSVIIGAMGRSDSFLLQSRAVDAGRTFDNAVGVPLTLVERQAIFFCPGCGVHLATFYGKLKDQLRREDLVVRLV